VEYRTFEKTGEKVSLLGFGAMRLPTLAGGEVDEAEAIRMIRHAIDSGVNYVDTAYMYHNGVSEVVVGKALKDGYREKVLLADKLPPWAAKDKAGLQKVFETQLERLDTDIDMYLVHSVEEGHMKQIEELEVFSFMECLRSSGKVKHVGFSYHGKTTEMFRGIIDSFDWDFCQIQLNYMDKDIQAGVEGMKYAASKGVPVVVMEPMKGGKLTQRVPDRVQALWDSADVRRTPAEWGFRWVADFPEVLTILSGMTTMEQLDDNLRILSDAKADSLTDGERGLIDQASAAYNELIKYGCTACGYCLPECPQKIDIPRVISLQNDEMLYDCLPNIKVEVGFVDPKPSVCVACGACEDICPQHLPIADIMKDSAERYL
jgi:predicted aldo/keto reductase-like oxidoreductase